MGGEIESENIQRKKAINLIKTFMNYLGLWPPDNVKEKRKSDIMIRCIIIGMSIAACIIMADLIYAFVAKDLQVKIFLIFLINYKKYTYFILNFKF